MSTFGGILAERELSFIRIDNFVNDIINGKVFLLSHFHSDHFKGLFDEPFLKVINDNPETVIYCTCITKNLMLAKTNCKIKQEKILEMDLNYPYVFFCNNTSVTVKALPAGHCPGSAMFCIEFEGTRIIYTGDIRMSPKELRCYTALHDSHGVLKPIDVLYLDTTFCDPRYLIFPSREQSLADIESIISWWLAKGQQKMIGIRYNSYHGLEWVLRAIANKNSTKIWILDEMAYKNYSGYPELSPFLSKVKESCKIHLCRVFTKSDCSVCSMFKEEMLTIKPCAMTFDFKLLQKQRFHHKDKNLVRVAYSTHCSFVELTSVVRYLKPKTIIPCVVPKRLCLDEVMVNLCLNVKDYLRDLLNTCKFDDVVPLTDTDTGPTTSSSAQEPFSFMRQLNNEAPQNSAEKILQTADYDCSFNFTCKRSFQIEENLIPYNIIWQEVGSSEHFNSQDNSNTRAKLPLFNVSISSDVIEDSPMKRAQTIADPLVQKRLDTSPQSISDDVKLSLTQGYGETSFKKSSSAKDEKICKRLRESSPHVAVKNPKTLTNVHVTDEEDDDSSTNTDTYDHLDSPPF